MLDTNQREIAESQFELNQRREAEVVPEADIRFLIRLLRQHATDVRLASSV